MRKPIPFVDRLNERGWVDRWGFLLFAFVGGAGILIAKAFGASPVLIAAGAALFMLLYAWIVDWAGTGRIRSDQAGDNCYYLGLIFTLVSLAYAIFTFDPADTATTIVQGFGIALSTTIMGLILRVFFNQARVDLVETEDTVRLELAEAAGRLKTELSQIIVRMNNFSHQTVQSLGELRSAVAQEISAATEGVKEAGAAAAQSIAAEAAETTTRMKRMATATDKVVKGLEGHGETLRRMEEASSGMATSVAAIADTASATKEALHGLTSQIEQLAKLHETMTASGRTLSEGLGGLQSAIGAFETTASRVDAQLGERLAAFQQAPVESMTEAAASMEATVRRVREELDRLVELQSTAADRIAAQSSSALETASRHNVALETELEKSRALVAQVHGAMVDLTGELVRRFEAPRSS